MLSGKVISRLTVVTVVKNPVLRGVLMAFGWLWVGIAFIGVVVPGIPTTGPILLAAFLFSKSSDRFDHWLVSNRFFGGIVRDWRAGNGFTVRAKTLAVLAIAVSFGVTTTWFVTAPYARAAMWLLAGSIAAYVITRPTKTTELAPTAVS